MRGFGEAFGEFAAEGPDGPLAGDYLRLALAGKEFHETHKPPKGKPLVYDHVAPQSPEAAVDWLAMTGATIRRSVCP